MWFKIIYNLEFTCKWISDIILFNYFAVPVIASAGEDSKVHLFTDTAEKVTV